MPPSIRSGTSGSCWSRFASSWPDASKGDFMIIGAHSIIYSKNAEADRVFLRDVLKLPNVEVGEGWLIFGLPPSEVAVHPGCLLYTSDAADERSSVDLGGRRI